MSSSEQPMGVVLAFGDEAGAEDVVAGLPLAVRAILELQRGGVSEVVLLIEDVASGEALIGDPRITVQASVRQASQWSALAEAVQVGAAVVVPARAVAHRDVIENLVVAAREGRTAVALPEHGLGPFVTLAAAPVASGAAALALEPVEAGWVLRAEDRAGKKRVVDALFEGCRKPVDGIVSRHLNRHVSIFVSKRIVDTSISPNTITVLTFFLGIAGALAAARASYGWLIAGAAILQANSILDGVDGELARVRFQYSKLGQWLDTICDDLANTLFYGGVTYAAFALPGLPSWLPWCGVGAVIGSALTMTMYYAELIRLGSGDFYALDVGQSVERSGWWAVVNKWARYATKRDFFVFSFLVAAIIGILPYILPIMAAGTVATVVTGLKITLARLRSGPARAR